MHKVCAEGVNKYLMAGVLLLYCGRSLLNQEVLALVIFFFFPFPVLGYMIDCLVIVNANHHCNQLKTILLRSCFLMPLEDLCIFSQAVIRVSWDSSMSLSMLSPRKVRRPDSELLSELSSQLCVTQCRSLNSS